jgi:putative ATPase
MELAIETTEPNESGIIHVSLEVAEDSIQQRAVLYDREGDAHYDTISAFIKSLRGSDPDAALYWMAKMVYAGENPRFIFRRMLIFAAEDIGLADPRAIQVAESCARAFEFVGLPEGQFHLAECCLYLATAPKSNTTLSFFDALKHVGDEQTGSIPDSLKDGSRDGKSLGHGVGYKYPHAFHNHYVPQQYLPDAMQGTYFYQPSTVGYERTIQERLDYWKSRDEKEDFSKRIKRYTKDQD